MAYLTQRFLYGTYLVVGTCTPFVLLALIAGVATGSNVSLKGAFPRLGIAFCVLSIPMFLSLLLADLFKTLTNGELRCEVWGWHTWNYSHLCEHCESVEEGYVTCPVCRGKRFFYIQVEEDEVEVVSKGWDMDDEEYQMAVFWHEFALTDASGYISSAGPPTRNYVYETRKTGKKKLVKRQVACEACHGTGTVRPQAEAVPP